MKAAIYTRYSSDKQKATSTEDQARNCLARVEREGWAVAAHYKDEAISGSTNKRPGYQSMLAAAQRHEFDVLVVDKLSRFGRDLVEQEQAANRLTFAGIRILEASGGYDSAVKKSKLMRQFTGAMNEGYNEEMADNIHRGLKGQVLKGYWAGGRCYGYALVQDTDPHRLNQYGLPQALGTRLRVNEQQAAVVRRIYERYASGGSGYAIAAELNADGIPSPRGGKWLASCISSNPKRGLGILNNQLYVGVYVWNRSQWVRNPDTKLHVPRARQEGEWVRPHRVDESLRIVPQRLWERVKQRQAERSHTIGARVKEGMDARKAQCTGRGRKYLLSGVMVCAQCGRPLNKVDAYSYACPRRRFGGVDACSNEVIVKRAAAESKLLRALKDELLSDANMERLRKKVRRLQSERQAAAGADRRALEAALAEQSRVRDNIMAAIKAGIFTPSTKAALESAEAEYARIEASLAHSARGGKVVALDPVPQLLSRVQQLVERFEQRVFEEGGAATDRAREDLKHVLGEVRVEGVMEDGKRVPYAIVGGVERLLLRAANGGGSVADKCGRGDRI